MYEENNTENGQIIDFEAIFKQDEVIEKYEQKLDPDKNRKNNIMTIILYLLIFMTFIGIILVPIISKISPKSTAHIALTSIVNSNNKDNIYLMSKNGYETEINNIDKKDLTLSIYNIENEEFKDYIFVSLSEDTIVIEFLNAQGNLNLILEGKKVIFPNIDPNIKVPILTYYESTSFLNSNFINNRNFISIGSFTGLQQGLIQFLSYLIVLIPLVFVNRIEMKDDFAYFKKEYHPVASKLLIGFAAMIAANFFLSFIALTIGNIFNVTSNSANQIYIETIINSSGFIFMAISVVILAPIVEELVFRKAAFGLIKNPKVAIIVSSSLFGLIHIQTELLHLLSPGGFNLDGIITVITLAISYVGMGLFLGYWYSKNNKNLSLLIGMHAIYNLFSILMILL